MIIISGRIGVDEGVDEGVEGIGGFISVGSVQTAFLIIAIKTYRDQTYRDLNQPKKALSSDKFY
jgi:hypothetical protein